MRHCQMSCADRRPTTAPTAEPATRRAIFAFSAASQRAPRQSRRQQTIVLCLMCPGCGGGGRSIYGCTADGQRRTKHQPPCPAEAEALDNLACMHCTATLPRPNKWEMLSDPHPHPHPHLHPPCPDTTGHLAGRAAPNGPDASDDHPAYGAAKQSDRPFHHQWPWKLGLPCSGRQTPRPWLQGRSRCARARVSYCRVLGAISRRRGHTVSRLGMLGPGHHSQTSTTTSSKRRRKRTKAYSSFGN